MTPIALRSAAALAAALVVLAAAAPAHAQGDLEGLCESEPDCVVNADSVVIDAEDAYAETVQRGEPHYLRAAIEMVVMLGAGTSWYWIDRERQVADWDFPSWKQRITLEAWRFDNNPFAINYAWHPIDGAGFHIFSRANDLSLPAAAGYGLATSLAWEYFLEFREKVSVNDMVVTTGAGVAIGEFVHWLGRYVTSEPVVDGPGYRVARWTLGLPRSSHGYADGYRLTSSAGADSLGLRTHIWHRFDLAYRFGPSSADITGRDAPGDASPQIGGAALRGRLVAIPGYLRPGRTARWFFDGNVTSARLEVERGSGSRVDARADTMLLGILAQDIASPLRGGRGWALAAGASLSYHYRRENLGAWSDRLALMHLPGLGLDVDLVGNGWRFHARGRAHADFASLEALAHDRWVAENPGVVEKTILRKQGYYYGWGLSEQIAAELELPFVSVGGALLHGQVHSQEGLDRSQERVTADARLSDTLVDLEAYARLHPVGALFVEGRWTRQTRRSQHDDLRARQVLERWTLGVGARF